MQTHKTKQVTFKYNQLTPISHLLVVKRSGLLNTYLGISLSSQTITQHLVIRRSGTNGDYHDDSKCKQEEAASNSTQRSMPRKHKRAQNRSCPFFVSEIWTSYVVYKGNRPRVFLTVLFQSITIACDSCPVDTTYWIICPLSFYCNYTKVLILG